jgi:hypothetical protein
MKVAIILISCIIAVFADYTTEDVAMKSKVLWDKVKHKEIEILYYVFKNFPEMQARFPAFVGKDVDSIKDSAAFAIHATRIISFISEYYSLAGSEKARPALKTISLQLAKNHKVRGISKEMMVRFKDTVMDFWRMDQKLTDDEYKTVQKSSEEFFDILNESYAAKH